MTESDYTPEFFAENVDKSRSSAEVVVPLVMERVAPRSVVDLGCGTGAWLGIFARHGVADYVGIDGDWVPPAALEIPQEQFIAARLDRPLKLKRRFDLAISLEVAEHLPESAASGFVRTAVRLAPCVLFSAAVPRQGGLHHVNEQWPDYWAALFAAHDYEVIDAIRPRIWSTEGVAWWYKQNTFIYAHPEVIASRPLLAKDRHATVKGMLSVVHPRMVDYVAADPTAHIRRPTPSEHSLREITSALPKVAARSLKWRLAAVLKRLGGSPKR
jgi:SAM-dependent methyltransferase